MNATVQVMVALSAVITAAGGFLVIYKQLREIHTLVNSRLTEALTEIKTLKSYIEGFTDAKGDKP